MNEHMSFSPELERRLPYLGASFTDAGLNDDEVRTFLDLCRGAQTYPTYQDLLAENRELADFFSDRLDILPIGYSSDYPADSVAPRRIEAAIINDGSSPDSIASFEAPQHSTELASVITARMQKHLHLLHPTIMQRMGLNGVAVSDHDDPDAMELQTWARHPRPTPRMLVFEGVRGGRFAQFSWSYPRDGFAGSSEAQASLAMHRQLGTRIAGLIHNSMPLAYNMVTPNFPALPGQAIDPMVKVYERLGLPINYCAAEQGRLIFISPGMYSLWRGGTNGAMVTDHLPAATVCYNPETPMLYYPVINMEPSGRTRAEALIERAEWATRCIGRLATMMSDAKFEQHDFPRNPAAKRLQDSVDLWLEMTPLFVTHAQNGIDFMPDDMLCQPLTTTEFLQTSAALIINTLMIVGNVRRLALMSGQFEFAWQLQEEIDNHLPAELGPVKMAPLDLVVCAQGLASLIAMRRAAEAR
jgi:hypothetical protein